LFEIRKKERNRKRKESNARIWWEKRRKNSTPKFRALHSITKKIWINITITNIRSRVNTGFFKFHKYIIYATEMIKDHVLLQDMFSVPFIKSKEKTLKYGGGLVGGGKGGSSGGRGRARWGRRGRGRERRARRGRSRTGVGEKGTRERRPVGRETETLREEIRLREVKNKKNITS
jgi:hypothetical protein